MCYKIICEWHLCTSKIHWETELNLHVDQTVYNEHNWKMNRMILYFLMSQIKWDDIQLVINITLNHLLCFYCCTLTKLCLSRLCSVDMIIQSDACLLWWKIWNAKQISHGRALTFFISKHDVRYGENNHEQCVHFVSYLKLIKIFVIYC